MEKRDRYISLFLHRSSKTLVLEPGVCYMAGVGIGYGEPVMLAVSDRPAERVGKRLLRLLKQCKRADIEAMAAHRKAGLGKYWQGREVDPKDLHPVDETPARAKAHHAIHERFPAMLKGAAAILRGFAWATLVERDAWKSRKLTQKIKSEYQGSVTDGESIRLPLRATAAALGGAVLGFVGER